MSDRKATQDEMESSFRKVLEDVVPIIQKLAPICGGSLEEVTSMVELALINNGQLRLLMEQVLKRAPQRTQ